MDRRALPYDARREEPQLRSLPVRSRASNAPCRARERFDHMPSRNKIPNRPAPKLGQNFLVDTSAQQAIVEALGNVSQQTVVEIGPGKGVLTDLLAERSKYLLAVEVDPMLAASLQRRWPEGSRVEVLRQDILQFDLAAWANQRQVRLQVIGNLPYYISSPILMHLFAHSGCMDRAVLMAQREVAERVAAAPGSSAYGLLSATTQMYATVENLFTLPPAAFSPAPKVFSSVIRLTMHSRFAELRVQPHTFIPFLRLAFALKRKTLMNNLRAAGYLPGLIQGAFAQCSLDLQTRAEAVPLETMACLFLAMGLPEK